LNTAILTLQNPDIQKKLGKGDVVTINLFRLLVKIKADKAADDDWMKITKANSTSGVSVMIVLSV
jgi:hypothetical protein